MALFFYEKRLKKNWFQFSKTEEFVCWEQWVITLNLTSPPQTEQGTYVQLWREKRGTNDYIEKLRSMKSAEDQFRQCLMKILEIVNESKEHIPSITTTDGNPFPYQVRKTYKQTKQSKYCYCYRLQYNHRQKVGVPSWKEWVWLTLLQSPPHPTQQVDPTV